jgi:putative mRNA 3-end processing factor
MQVIRHRDSFKVKTADYTISLDCSTPDSDFNFLSHSHSDHLFRTSKNVIASDETIELAKIRGFDYNRLINIPKNISLMDSGHMIGSKSLYLQEKDESLLFTGDFSTASRAFIKGLKVKECSNLIIESTFGKPEFIFPDASKEVKRAKDFIEDNIKKNYLTVLMGYPLGKMQEIMHYFKEYFGILHPEIARYKEALDKFGLCQCSNCLNNPDILFSPSLNSKNEYFDKFKKSRGLKFAVFSGWNLNPYYKKRFGADEGFTLSDHADFKELLDTVKKSGAKNVYVHHGYSKEFREFLKIEGINAVDI